MHKRAGFFGVAAMAAAALAGCGGGSSNSNNNQINNPDTLGLTTTNQFVVFDRNDPTRISSTSNITGLAGGETLVAFDVRPSNQDLYALSDAGRLYRVNRNSGAATAIGGTFAIPLNGTSFGFDFNPVADLLRIVSNTGQNFRVDPDTGEVVDSNPGTAGVQGDADLQYAPGDSGAGLTPNIVSIAYTNSVSGAGSTELFGIDASRNVLVRINVPAGTLTTIGPLGVNVGNIGGLDIKGTSGTAFAVSIAGGQARLLQIDLTTGAAIDLGVFPNNNIQSIATL